jgi:hypothetical protein
MVRRIWIVALVVLLPACSRHSSSPPLPDAVVDSAVADSAAESISEVPVVKLPAGCRNFGTAGATSSCLVPTHLPDYYVEQA